MRYFMITFGLVLIFLSSVMLFVHKNEPFYLIAFLSNRTGRPEIFHMYPDGSNTLQLTNTMVNRRGRGGNHLPCQAQWIEGRFEIFGMLGHIQDGFYCIQRRSDFVKMNGLNGEVHTEFSTYPPSAWSPDMKLRLHIEPAMYQGSSGFDYEIYTMEGNIKRLVTRLANADSLSAHWVGEWIVFKSDPDMDYRYEIFRVRQDGSGLQKLIRPLGRDLCPQHSIANNWVYFVVQDRAYGCTRLFRADLSSPHFRAELVANLPSETVFNTEFVSSPNGQKIAYWDNEGKIFVLSGEATAPILKLFPQIRSLSWSPDGAWLTFTACQTACNIYRIQPDGKNLEPLTGGYGDSAFPAYSPMVDESWGYSLPFGAGFLLLAAGVYPRKRK